MNVGDRVRLLTGTEEGIITRLLDSELVEVAIDNDFTIPVLRREVVVVAAEEDKNFDRSAPTLGPGQQPGRAANASKKARAPKGAAPKAAAPASASVPARPSLADALHAAASSGPGAARPAAAGRGAGGGPGAPAARGLFAALVPQSPELLGVVLVNNTEAEVLFTYAESTAARPYRALATGVLAPRTASKNLSFLHLKDFEEWPALVFQLLPSRPNGDTAYELLTKRQAFKAATFYGSRRPAPVIGKDAYLFALDEQQAAALTPERLLAAEAPASIAPVAAAPKAAPASAAQTALAAPAAPAPTVLNAEALRAQLTGDAPRPAAPSAPARPVVAPPHEVDLHFEALRPNAPADLSNTAIMREQLDAFEDALSRALATNMHEIVFIHGTGNGTLRKEIHRQLSRNKDIKFFEDAQKEKFGFGATLVRLK